MKVFVIGGGGREHTLVWKIAQSPRVIQNLLYPGKRRDRGIGRVSAHQDR